MPYVAPVRAAPKPQLSPPLLPEGKVSNTPTSPPDYSDLTDIKSRYRPATNDVTTPQREIG